MTPEPAALPYEKQVLEYITDCKRAKAFLDPQYHPTEAGVLKIVFHGGDKTKAQQIRETFRALSGVTVLAARRAA